MKLILLISLSLPLAVSAQSVSLGAFIDTYYALDSNNPLGRERAPFITQPARHNEFNINMAYVEAVLTEKERRGRLALQYGTSVDRNYAQEENKSIQTIQEAYAGVKLGERLWIDAGVFFSHMGIESFISKYNINYSRSLNADNVPYYAAGVRLEYQLSNKETVLLHLINGWQNIQENNSGKAIALRYQRSLSASDTFTYNNFLGDERVTTYPSRFRTYHNFIFERKVDATWILKSSFDIGTQAQRSDDGVDLWFATSVILGQKLNEVARMGYRFEYYLDRHQANVLTDTENGFKVLSLSTNYDRSIAKDTLWRNELRIYHSEDKIFPKKSGGASGFDGMLVTSLGISF